MADDSRPNGRVRWRWILPTLAVEVTLLLELTGRYERRPSGMGYTSTSWGIEAILNYPAIRLDNLFRLVERITYSHSDAVDTAIGFATRFGCVVLFWLWIGWVLDTRKHREEVSPSKRQLIWASCFYSILFAYCIVDVWANWSRFGVMAYSLVHENLSPLKIWDFDSAVGAIWFATGAVYFAKRVLSLWRSRSL